MSTLITGGAGFIGSQLAARLLELQQPVVILDNFDDYYDPAIKRAKIAALGSAPVVIEGDIRDKAATALAKIGPDAKGAIPSLAKALRDNDPALRRGAVYALANIITRDNPDAKEALPGLSLAFRDMDPEIRRNAEHALQAIGEPAATSSNAAATRRRSKNAAA